MAFCKVCDREVGVEKNSRAIWIIGFLILGFMQPFGSISIPVCWGIAFFLVILPRNTKCGICKSPLFSSGVSKSNHNLSTDEKKKNSDPWKS